MMFIVIAFIAGILFAAAFPAPSATIRSMVGFMWAWLVENFKALNQPKDPPKE